jgi:hypothetical protein
MTRKNYFPNLMRDIGFRRDFERFAAFLKARALVLGDTKIEVGDRQLRNWFNDGVTKDGIPKLARALDINDDALEDYLYRGKALPRDATDRLRIGSLTVSDRFRLPIPVLVVKSGMARLEPADIDWSSITLRNALDIAKAMIEHATQLPETATDTGYPKGQVKTKGRSHQENAGSHKQE